MRRAGSAAAVATLLGHCRVLALLALAWAGAAVAQVPEGWTVACEAGGCRASLASANGRQALLLARLPGSDALSLGFSSVVAIPDRERPIALRLDGRALGTLAPGRGYGPLERVEAFWLFDARVATAIVQGAGGGRRLRIEYVDVTGAPEDADFALDGLAAVAAGFDQALGRKAGREAAAPKGLAAAPDTGKAELVMRQGLPQRLIDKHRAASDCEDPGSALLKPVRPVIGPLSKTAMLYAIPCVASGADISYRLWVIESGEIGGITALYFAVYDAAFGWRGTDLLANVGFEPASARLTARSAARGAGSCGSRGVWRWKDFAFAMEEFRVAVDCRGSPDPADWPRVHPAK